MNKDIEYSKICTGCGNSQLYSCKLSLNNAIKAHSLCNSCNQKKNRRVFTVEEIKLTLDLYKEGLSFTKISKRINIRKETIKRILIDNNVLVEGRDSTIIVFNIEDIKNILNDFINNKKTITELTREYKTSYGVIRRLLEQNFVFKKRITNKKSISIDELVEIKKLYLDDLKSTKDISKIINCSESNVSKLLSREGILRSKSDANTLYRTGRKLSESHALNIKLGQQKFAKSGNRVQKGGICKTYRVNGIKCQGTYEKFYLEKLILDGIELPNRAKSINTPYGVYYPDFSYDNRLIEIKCNYTFEILIGKRINNFTKNFEINQYNKIKWVNENVIPVDVFVIDKKNNEIIKKYLN